MGLTFEDKMRAAITLFQENKHQANEVIKRGRKQGLKEAQTREGMVRVWERVQAGETIKPIQMAWEAWAEAKNAQGQEFLEYEFTREELRMVIRKLRKQRDIGIVIVAALSLLCVSLGYFLWLG